MRQHFIGYYGLTEEEFRTLWKECFFSFDANVLLNFYRYKTDTRDKLFQVLRTLNDRIWLTHQVALEYFQNRLSVIQAQMDAYAKLVNTLKDSKVKLSARVWTHSMTQ